MARSRDLTVGPLRGHFRALAVPAAIGMVFNTLYNAVDVYFAGMLNTEAQAGLAIAFQAFFIIVAVGIGLGAAMGALVGNAIGAKDGDDARQQAAQGLGFGVIVSLVLMVFGLWAGPQLINLLSEPGDYRDASTQYFLLLNFAAPAFLLAFGANGVLQALGDTVSMQYALAVAFVANCVLNPLFIFGFSGIWPGLWDGIGFNGIALSTLVSQTGVMAYVIWRVLRSDLATGLCWADFKPRIAAYRQITGQAMPTSFAMVVMITAGFVIQFYLKSFGQSAVAAYGVALRIEQLFLLPVFGLTGALLPIIAQNFGGGHNERARAALFDCWKFGWLFMCVACPILWFAAEPMMAVFTSDPEVIRIGTSYLHVDGVILPIYMMLFAINSFLQALKKPIWTLWIGIYRQAFAVALFVWMFVSVLDYGVWGVWYGVATAVITGLVLSLVVAHFVSKPLIGGLIGNRKFVAAE